MHPGGTALRVSASSDVELGKERRRAMVEVEVASNGRIVVSPEYEGTEYDEQMEIEQAFSRVMTALTELDDLEDPSVAGSVATGEIEISITVTAETQGAAVDSANALIHRALHTAEIQTPEWHKAKAHLTAKLVYEWHVTQIEGLLPVAS